MVLQLRRRLSRECRCHLRGHPIGEHRLKHGAHGFRYHVLHGDVFLAELHRILLRESVRLEEALNEVVMPELARTRQAESRLRARNQPVLRPCGEKRLHLGEEIDTVFFREKRRIEIAVLDLVADLALHAVCI